MMKLKLSICILCLSFIVFSAKSQENGSSDIEALKTAYLNFKQGNYNDAYIYFSRMLETYPKDPTYNYYTGICLLNIENNPENALGKLRYAATKDVPDDVYFYLGLAYHRNYQFNEALKNFLWFEKRATKNQIKDYDLKNYISRTQNGLYLIKYAKKYSVYSKENIPKDEFYKQYQFNDLEGKFIYSHELFNPNADSLIDGALIFVPNLLERNEVLYFAALNDSRGDYDIYRVTKLTDTTWSRPENLGDVINTPFDENFPYIHSDGTTLYFSSKGHYSMGGYDIYKSSWDWEKQTWSEPENLDFPVNSPYDDFLFVPSPNNKLALFSSNRYCTGNEYTVYKIDPGHSYVEIENHQEILQLASLDVNATLDAQKLKKSKTEENRKKNQAVKPSINQDFLYKYEYDSLMNLAVNYQMQADSLKWIIDEKRDLFGQTPDGQSRAILSNEIIELEQQVYRVQKNADMCYEKVREIEQINLASKNISYDSLDQLPSQEKDLPKANSVDVVQKRNEYVFNDDSLHKIELYSNHENDKEHEFGLKINTPSIYNKTNPIPLNEELSPGIVYMIQMGAFSSVKNPEIFKGLEPLSAIKNENSEIRKYFAGKFRTISEAEQNIPKVKSRGFKDAFIVAFHDGKIIPVKQAVKLESKELQKETVKQREKDEHDGDIKKDENLSIIYTLNFSLISEDSVYIENIKELLPESKDIFLEKNENKDIFTIKSFDNFDEAFALKEKIELMINKEVEVYAYFAENQIPLDQARKMTE